MTVARGFGRLLLNLMGIEMKNGCQTLAVAFVPDGQGELWQRTFESGRFTSRFEMASKANGHNLVELFGPFSLYYQLAVGADDIRWKLRHTRLFGVLIPASLAPRIAAREWVSNAGEYQMCAQVTMPLLGHLLSYRGTLARVAA